MRNIEINMVKLLWYFIEVLDKMLIFYIEKNIILKYQI